MKRASYSLRHLVVLQLLFALPLDSEKTLHNLLFLANAATGGAHPEAAGFYDFIRTKTGVHSPAAQQVLADLREWELVDKKSLALTPRGREVYYFTASILHYDRHARRVLELAMAFARDPRQADLQIRRHLQVRRARLGERIPVRPGS